MPQKNTYIMLSISIFVALISIGMFLFAFNAIRNKNQYASALSQTIQEKISVEENVTEFKKVINDTKKKQETLKSFIVDQEKIDEFATYIEKQGDTTGVPVNIRNVEISTVDPTILILSFDGLGSFENMMHLIWAIENTPYKININNLSLNYNIEGKWQINMSIGVISSVFK